MGFHDDDFSAEICLVCGWLVKRVDRVSEDSDGSRREYQAIAPREEYPWIHRYEAGERLPEESRGKVWQTDLAAQGVADWGELRVRGGIGQPEPPPTLERYYDGQPMTLARWPNQGFVEVSEVVRFSRSDRDYLAYEETVVETLRRDPDGDSGVLLAAPPCKPGPACPTAGEA